MQLSELWKVLASVVWATAGTSWCQQAGSHRIVGTCGTHHITDTSKNAHPTLFAEGTEGSLIPLVPVKDVGRSIQGVPETVKSW